MSTVKDSEDSKSEISKTASWPSGKRSTLVKPDKTQGQAEKHTVKCLSCLILCLSLRFIALHQREISLFNIMCAIKNLSL